MKLSDGDLWNRSRKGDQDAFGLLFERHAQAIYNYCFRRIGDWAVAEDLTSIAFLEAWRRREKKLPDDKVLPWLYGIATNVVRNRQRAERRFVSALSRVPVPVHEPDFAEESQQRIDDEREIERAIALLGQLPLDEQDVFVLLCLDAGELRRCRVRSRCPSRHRSIETVTGSASPNRTRIQPPDIRV